MSLATRHDYTEWGHTEAPRLSSIARFLEIAKALLLFWGGAHPATARRICSLREQLDIMILGLVLLGSMCLTALSVTNFLHAATDDDQFHVSFLVVGLLISLMQGITDNVVQYRSSYPELGQSTMLWAGYRIPTLKRDGFRRAILTIVRIIQAAGLSVLACVTVLMFLLAPNLKEYNLQLLRTQHPEVYQQVEHDVDANIKRAEDDLKASSDRLIQLNRFGTTLRQGNVQRLSQKRGSSSAVAASDAQIAKLEASIAAETLTHDALAEKSEKLKTGRENQIERTVSASTHVASGLGGKLNALTGVLKDSWKLFIMAVAIQVASAALELAPMWAIMVWWPIRYAGYLSERRWIDSRLTGDHLVQEIGPSPVMLVHAPPLANDPSPEAHHVDEPFDAEGLTSSDSAYPTLDGTPDMPVAKTDGRIQNEKPLPEPPARPDSQQPAKPSLAQKLGLNSPSQRGPRGPETNGASHD